MNSGRRVKRGSQLDPYKGLIVRWLEAHPLSAQQIFQRLREAGYRGGLTIVNMYVRQIRPPKQKAFLKLDLRHRRMRPNRLGRIRLGRCRLHAPALELLCDGAMLLAPDVCGVHRLADHGALPRLP